jgi:Asp/Glu/hydantoin racemase
MITRIWHQSMTGLERLPGYRAMLSQHAAEVGQGDLRVDLHGVQPGTYPDGMAPVALTRYAWAHHLIHDQFVENAVSAQAQGYDAIAISCFADPALDLARSAVDIPVVSSCETALLTSCSIGTTFGLLTIEVSMVRVLRRLVARYGFSERVRVIDTLDPAMDEFELDEAFHGRGPLVERFTAQARRLIERHDIDVLIPAEGVLNTMLVRNGVRSVDDVPVLDGYGALLMHAQMMVRLRSRTGLTTGRRTAYAKPPADVMRHLRRVTCSVLERGSE